MLLENHSIWLIELGFDSDSTAGKAGHMKPSPRRDFLLNVRIATLKSAKGLISMFKTVSPKFAVFGAALCVLSSSGSAFAQDRPIKGVVELFTSQSCSSCPPADKVLGEVIMRGDVLGLAFHVDYWNYLDWKDTFSNQESTKRQYAYAKSLNSRQVYTPQMIVNGTDVVAAGSPEAVFQAMDAAGDGALSVDISAGIENETLVVKAGKGKGDANLVLLVFETREMVDIKRGENSGKKIEYHNAVTQVRTLGMWKGEDLSVELPKREYLTDEGYSCAVILQRVTAQGTPGEIIGAALVSGLGA